MPLSGGSFCSTMLYSISNRGAALGHVCFELNELNKLFRGLTYVLLYRIGCVGKKFSLFGICGHCIEVHNA